MAVIKQIVKVYKNRFTYVYSVSVERNSAMVLLIGYVLIRITIFYFRSMQWKRF